MFTTPIRPRANSHAVTPLIRMPTAATAETVSPGTVAGSPKRFTASTEMAPIATSSSTAFASAARIVDPFRPYVKRFDGGVRASTAPAQATARPSTSDRLCPASASSATEPVHSPADASATT